MSMLTVPPRSIVLSAFDELAARKQFSGPFSDGQQDCCFVLMRAPSYGLPAREATLAAPAPLRLSVAQCLLLLASWSSVAGALTTAQISTMSARLAELH